MKMTKDIKMRFNPIFKPVHQSRQRYIIMKGSAGSGKSVDTAQSYILRLMDDKGRNLLCVRKSEVTNRDSTFAELVGAINRNGLAPYWKATMSPLQLICRANGNSIIFRGMNDERQREKLKSITFHQGKLTDVWLEEMTELTKDDVEIIDDRLRGDLPDGLFYQIKGTFNPVSKTHWIKRDFFDIRSPDVLTHHSTYLDNRFIDAAYHRRMLRRKELDPEGYRIYGLGEWGEIGGLILTNYIIEEFDRAPERFDNMVNAQDFGFNHANCVGEVGFKDGELYVCREIYEYEKDTEELIRLANKKGIRKKIPMYCDSAEPDRIQMWKKAGYKARAVKKEPGSVHAQIDCLKQRKIHIHPSCVHTIKEIQQWKWKKDERLNIYLDEPVNVFDDAMAMLRYSVEEIRRERTIKVNLFKGGI
ncbi:PBSX family phage terminase large subunit [Eubacterium callanderi]|uniref:PBSX family phage terminase large subunit n=2 Tax=Eubacterium callanderi TaxID=53442 RepID=A0A853JU79_9FIRM|nr:PBSX family phage terminase large subunit [Eubacterium callanderi]